MKLRNLLLLLPLFTCAPLAQAYDDGDFQSWLDFYVVKKVNDRVSLRVEEELQFGDDSSDFYYYHTDFSVSYKLFPYLSFALAYRHIDTKKNGEWSYEDRPHANITWKGVLGGLQIEDRNRFEWRDRPGVNNFMRNRNKLTFLYPVTVGAFTFTPYTFVESFIDTDTADFNQFYTAAGVKKKFGHGFEGDLYYLWQTTEKNTDWTDTHYLGAAVGYVF